MTIDETLKIVNYLRDYDRDYDNDDILNHLIRIETLITDLIYEMHVLNKAADKEKDDDLPF